MPPADPRTDDRAEFTGDALFAYLAIAFAALTICAPALLAVLS